MTRLDIIQKVSQDIDSMTEEEVRQWCFDLAVELAFENQRKLESIYGNII